MWRMDRYASSMGHGQVGRARWHMGEHAEPGGGDAEHIRIAIVGPVGNSERLRPVDQDEMLAEKVRDQRTRWRWPRDANRVCARAEHSLALSQHSLALSRAGCATVLLSGRLVIDDRSGRHPRAFNRPRQHPWGAALAGALPHVTGRRWHDDRLVRLQHTTLSAGPWPVAQASARGRRRRRIP